MKKITFVLKDTVWKESYPPITPEPSISIIPEWYKNGETFISKTDASLNIRSEEDKAAGLKTCVPFLDAITSGYLILSWYSVEITKNFLGDIQWRYVEKDKYGIWQEINVSHSLFEERPGSIGYTMPRPKGFAKNHMAWAGIWGIQTPKGWSALITHPFNRHELPFLTLTGFVDSDRFAPSGNIPFYLEDGWTGIIEKGTPIAQVIPVKRKSWISFKSLESENPFYMWLIVKTRSINYGYYRINLWVKKKYESFKK